METQMIDQSEEMINRIERKRALARHPDLQALLQGCLAHPLDVAPRQVFADWLMENSGWYDFPLASQILAWPTGVWAVMRHGELQYAQWEASYEASLIQAVCAPGIVDFDLAIDERRMIGLRFIITGVAPVCANCQSLPVVFDAETSSWLCYHGKSCLAKSQNK